MRLSKDPLNFSARRRASWEKSFSSDWNLSLIRLFFSLSILCPQHETAALWRLSLRASSGFTVDRLTCFSKTSQNERETPVTHLFSSTLLRILFLLNGFLQILISLDDRFQSIKMIQPSSQILSTLFDQAQTFNIWFESSINGNICSSDLMTFICQISSKIQMIVQFVQDGRNGLNVGSVW